MSKFCGQLFRQGSNLFADSTSLLFYETSLIQFVIALAQLLTVLTVAEVGLRLLRIGHPYIRFVNDLTTEVSDILVFRPLVTLFAKPQVLLRCLAFESTCFSLVTPRDARSIPLMSRRKPQVDSDDLNLL